MNENQLKVATRGSVVELRIPMPDGTVAVVDLSPRESRELGWSLLRSAAAAGWTFLRGVL